MEKLDANKKNYKLKTVYESLTCAAKLNIALGFVFRNIEDVYYRYFYPHEDNTLFDNAHLVSGQDDLTNLQAQISKLDPVESCARER